MKLNKAWIISLTSLVVLVLATVIYLVIVTKPTTIPDQLALVEEINEKFPGAAARDIQDIIYMDKKHAFIPFVSVRGDYSFSLWQWKFDEWELVNINSNGFPISVKDRTYGVMKLPDEWVHILKAIGPTQNVQNSFFTFNRVRYQPDIKAIPYDHESNFVFPERSVNGSQYSSGKFNFQYIFIMDETDLDVVP